eukprot:CAMPEP_0170192558 /NCGR_PEP_ID=MMETSP0040_2-20121228/54551_1 /TAXON_ID=641309 /ORGANISM="Lotharella oceanica, Strain CCMP622" /LENGTH=98 /DNA_ID=CAMNT_0010440969 /DNA_START=208 /DNA_END=504 /DNA_ORIENTATION=-
MSTVHAVARYRYRYTSSALLAGPHVHDPEERGPCHHRRGQPVAYPHERCDVVGGLRVSLSENSVDGGGDERLVEPGEAEAGHKDNRRLHASPRATREV